MPLLSLSPQPPFPCSSSLPIVMGRRPTERDRGGPEKRERYPRGEWGRVRARPGWRAERTEVYFWGLSVGSAGRAKRKMGSRARS